MKRFQQLLTAAKGRGSPFSRPDPVALRRAASELTAQDVCEFLDELDAMSRERTALPDWDGDSSDTIALYQEDLTQLLGASTGPARQALEQDGAPREAMTRPYIAIALSTPGHRSLWWTWRRGG